MKSMIHYVVAVSAALLVSATTMANEAVENTAPDTNTTLVPNVEVVQKGQKTILVSPRTGMRYVLTNPANRTVVFQTELLAPVTAQNINRITATNPALSAASQAQAEQALLDMAGLKAIPAQDAPIEQTVTAN